MAAIDVQYKGLTGLIEILSLDTANTVAEVKTAAIADEGLTSGYYNIMALESDPNINSVNNASNTLAEINYTASDIFYFSVDQDGTLEYRQVQRIDIAELKRQGGPTANTSLPCYRTLNTANVDLLPSKYIGNTSTPNPHPSGLQEGRPWE